MTMQEESGHPRCPCCGCQHLIVKGKPCFLQQVPKSDGQSQFGNYVRLDTSKIAKLPDYSIVDMIVTNCENYGCMATAPQHIRDTVRARIKDLMNKFEENRKTWDEKRQSGNQRALDAYTAPENRTS